MANVIKIKQSSVASRVPQAVDLEQGELAINTNDEKLYTKNSSGSVVELGRIPAINEVTDVTVSSPVDGQLLQYNSTTSKWENVTKVINTFSESATAPTSPIGGDTWYDESEGKIFMRIALGGSGKWIEIGTNETVNTVESSDGYDGGDATPTITGEVDGGDANTNTHTETINGGSANSSSNTVDWDGGDASTAATLGVNGGNASTTRHSGTISGGTSNATSSNNDWDGGSSNSTSTSNITGGNASTTTYNTTINGGSA